MNAFKTTAALFNLNIVDFLCIANLATKNDISYSEKTNKNKFCLANRHKLAAVIVLR